MRILHCQRTIRQASKPAKDLSGAVELIMHGQCFQPTDLVFDSLLNDPGHQEVSTSIYANLACKGTLTPLLDFALLSCAEIDTAFNVNTVIGYDGRYVGGIGGGPNVGRSKLTVIFTRWRVSPDDAARPPFDPRARQHRDHARRAGGRGAESRLTAGSGVQPDAPSGLPLLRREDRVGSHRRCGCGPEVLSGVEGGAELGCRLTQPDCVQVRQVLRHALDYT
jgi:hypothetical protein